MLAPQSREEIRPIVEAIQAMDALIDVWWEPKAVIVAKGSYSVMGKRIDPTYEGRWQVIRYKGVERTAYGIIKTVVEYMRVEHRDVSEGTRTGEGAGVLVMVAERDNPAYAPIDGRLVEYLRAWDNANVAMATALRDKMWAHNDRIEATAEGIDDAEAIEALDHNHFEANYAGGVGNWSGRGADFKEMEKKSSLILTP